VPAEDKYIRYEGITNDFENPIYDEVYARSIEDREGFWAEKAQELHWDKFPTTIIDTSDQYLHRWYTDGMQNICYNCVDRHVDGGRGDAGALIYESAYTGACETYTYRELQANVAKLASIFATKYGVQAGDRVLIYCPMVPPAAFAMLACARIGAIHSVVFGGFAAKELANRIDDCLPKLIFTCSAGLEPKKVIKYAPIVD